MEPLDLFLIFLEKQKICGENEELKDAETTLTLDFKGFPILTGSFCRLNSDTYEIHEYHFNGRQWKDISYEVKGEETTTPTTLETFSDDEEITEESLPPEVKFFLKELPNDPDKIPIGPKREYLRKIPVNILEKYYPKEKFKTLYEWMSTK